MKDQGTENSLAARMRACEACRDALPGPPRPIFRMPASARVVLISQAPSRRADAHGRPWAEQSGDLLRDWLGVDASFFFESDFFAVLPMSFCYPGRAGTGDRPPLPNCAPTWHALALQAMPRIALKVLLGRHAQAYYLPQERAATLTDRVRRAGDFLPHCFPMPHPSPLTRPWRRRNPWFARETVPLLRGRIRQIREKDWPA